MGEGVKKTVLPKPQHTCAYARFRERPYGQQLPYICVFTWLRAPTT